MALMATTVLIGEDEELILEGLKMLLEAKGYRVLCAADGEAACEIARREKPDVLVLDVGLPKLSGVDVCRKIKSDPETRSVKVLVATGQGRQEAIAEAMAAGADGYLLKPFGGPKLLEALQKLLPA